MNAYKRGVRLSLTVSPQVSRYIDRLARTGLHGRNRAEVAQRLLYAQVREIEVREVQKAVFR